VTIASLSDLTTKVGQWLFGRTDLAPIVPDFVTLFEAKANRTLFVRQMETRVIATIDPTSPEPEYLALPPNFQTMRRVRLLNSSTNRKPRLTFATGAQLDDERDKIDDQPGEPVFFTLFGSEMELCPTPDQTYKVEMVYRTNIPGLGSLDETGSAITTNWLLQMAPDAYLYGALMEAAPYLMDDDRIPTWATGVQAAFKELNDLSEEALYNAGPLVMRSRRRSY
jgi:hypothetical protein